MSQMEHYIEQIQFVCSTIVSLLVQTLNNYLS